MKKDEKFKFLILTDSRGNPRSFLFNNAVTVEQTYPYLLREFYPDAIFWQLSCGGVFATQDLMDEAITYLNDWKPDFIIIDSGMNDCRPEVFTEFQKMLISVFSGPIFRYLRRYMYHPRLIKVRQVYRVSKRKFKKNLNKFKMIFDESKIIYIEITAFPGYANTRPGVTKRMNEYNEIVRQVYPDGFVGVEERLSDGRGYLDDNLHLNLNGHRIVAEAIRQKINYYLENKW